MIHSWACSLNRGKVILPGSKFLDSLLKCVTIPKLPQRTQQHLSGDICQAGFSCSNPSQKLCLLLFPFQAVFYMREEGRCFFTSTKKLPNGRRRSGRVSQKCAPQCNAKNSGVTGRPVARIPWQVVAEFANEFGGVLPADFALGLISLRTPVFECLFDRPVFSQVEENALTRPAVHGEGLDEVIAESSVYACLVDLQHFATFGSGHPDTKLDRYPTQI